MSSSTSTSLTLRALLKTTADRAGFAPSGRPIGGLTPSAKAYFAAAACARGRVLLLAPTDADVEQLTSDARFFLSALEGLSDAEAARVVLPFPSQEIDPYRGLAPHFDVASTRAATLFAIASGAARLVVASAPAVLPRLSPPRRLAAAGLVLRSGLDISPQDLGDRLVEAGYSRQDPTDEPGEFSVRGGVVDFFPAGAKQPIRLEFVGDTIESVRSYDPETQRSTGAVDQAHIVPLQELLTEERATNVGPLRGVSESTDEGGPEDTRVSDESADRSATFLDFVETMRPAVIVSEPDDVRAAILKRREHLEASF
jgi:transcription-repair coupling factor (superfamily II helicase)